MAESPDKGDVEVIPTPSPRRPTVPRVAVVGVGGYAGGEIARLLLRHPRLSGRSPILFGRPSEGTAYLDLGELHPSVISSDGIKVFPFSWERVEQEAVQLLFLATPTEQSRVWAPEAIKRDIRVVDLSGAWRLNGTVSSQVDGVPLIKTAEECSLLSEVVYGSPELHKDAIAGSRLIANPGCYATSVILALAPLLRAALVDLGVGIVCDAKSGVSGAGKEPSPTTHFMHVADNLSAYAVFGHRHTGELLEQLHLKDSEIQFTPHLLPIPRGILTTIYLRLRQPSDPESLTARLRHFYRDCPFIRIRRAGTLPEIQHVVRSNFCDIGLAVHPDGHRTVIVSCLDNLLKGASGQAVQNMNLMYGWDETEGLL